MTLLLSEGKKCEEGVQNIAGAFQNCVTGNNYACMLIANPLQRMLPRLIVVVQSHL